MAGKRPLLILVVWALIGVNAIMVKNVKILKYFPCKLDEPQLAVFNTSSFRMKGGRNKILINGFGEMTEDLMEPIAITFNRTKCEIKTDDCEQHNTITIPNACFLMTTHILGFFAGFRPSITECPIKKGRYDVENVEVDMSFFANIPMNGLWYQTQLVMQSNGRVGFCVELHWTMSNARPSRRKE